MRQPRLFLLLIASPLLGGCEAMAIAAIAGVGGFFAYSENELSADYRVDIDEAWDVAELCLDALEYPAEREVITGADFRSLAVGDVWLRMEEHPGDVLRIRIRVGTFVSGDHRRRARALLEMIEQELEVKPLPEPATPSAAGSASG